MIKSWRFVETPMCCKMARQSEKDPSKSHVVSVRLQLLAIYQPSRIINSDHCQALLFNGHSGSDQTSMKTLPVCNTYNYGQADLVLYMAWTGYITFSEYCTF